MLGGFGRGRHGKPQVNASQSINNTLVSSEKIDLTGLVDYRAVYGTVQLGLGLGASLVYSYFLSRADALADATVRTQAVRKLSGVDSVEVTLNKELLMGKEFVHSLIRGKIRERERKPKMD